MIVNTLWWSGAVSISSSCGIPDRLVLAGLCVNEGMIDRVDRNP
jgi:hypothetical protein